MLLKVTVFGFTCVVVSNSMCWDYITTQFVIVVHRKQHRGAVLALAFPQPSCLVTGCNDKKVREFDLRVPVSLVADHQEHKKPVLSLASSEDYVYSGGEDKTVCVWDRRGRGVPQTVKVGHTHISLIVYVV